MLYRTQTLTLFRPRICWHPLTDLIDPWNDDFSASTWTSTDREVKFEWYLPPVDRISWHVDRRARRVDIEAEGRTDYDQASPFGFHSVRSVQRYRRSFTFPQDVDMKRVNVSTRNGVLIITAPRQSHTLSQAGRRLRDTLKDWWRRVRHAVRRR